MVVTILENREVCIQGKYNYDSRITVEVDEKKWGDEVMIAVYVAHRRDPIWVFPITIGKNYIKINGKKTKNIRRSLCEA